MSPDPRRTPARAREPRTRSTGIPAGEYILTEDERRDLLPAATLNDPPTDRTALADRGGHIVGDGAVGAKHGEGLASVWFDNGEPRRVFIVRVPAVMKYTTAGMRPDWLSSNDRRNVYAEANLRAQWREQSRAAVLQAKLPRRGADALPCTVVATVYYHTSSRKRDASNLADTLKPLLDGVTDAGFWPDDNDEHVYRTSIEPGGPRERPCIILTITEQTRRTTP